MAAVFVAASLNRSHWLLVQSPEGLDLSGQLVSCSTVSHTHLSEEEVAVESERSW